MVQPVTTEHTVVKDVAPRRNEEEHNGKEGPTMPSMIQFHLTKESLSNENQTN